MAANSSLAKMLAVICLNLILVALVNSQDLPAGSPVLTPPYFNLAYERRVSATSTCGEGNVAEERFCKLTGADPTEGHNEGSVIEGGQLCDVCLSPERAERLRHKSCCARSQKIKCGEYDIKQYGTNGQATEHRG